jgi:hypothetical protein
MLKKALTVSGFSCAVWAFCGALVGIGRQFMNMDATLIVHAIGAPIGATALGWVYFRNFGYTRPLATAAIFVVTAMLLDVFIVAMLIEKSFEMFRSILGVWIPQVFIFLATMATGMLTMKSATSSLR